jgi:O-antigen/teichoic acid export membrane protein
MNEEGTPGRFTGLVIRGVSLAGGGWVFSQVLNLAIYLVLARLASPEEFGQLAAGAILVAVGGLFANSGMTAALIQRSDRLEEAANTALVSTLLAGFGLSLVALAAAPLVGVLFDSREVAWVAAAASTWIFLRTATAVPDALMQRRFSFLRRLVVEPIGVVVFGATAIVTLAAGLGVWGLVIGNTAQRLAMLVASWGLARWRPQPRLASLDLWREMISYGRHVITGEIIRKVGGQVQTALIGRFLGTAPLGQYTYAQRIAQKPHGLVVNAAGFVLFPAFSRISHDAERLRQAFSRSLRWICLLGMPLGFLMLPLGVPLAVLLFGTEWRLAGEAAAAMCAYVGFRSIVSLAAEAAKAAGRPQVLVRLYTVSAILTVALVAAGLPFGLVGVGAGISASAVGTAAYAMLVVSRPLELPVRRMIPQVWPALLGAVTMALAVLSLDRLLIEAEGLSPLPALFMIAAEMAFAAAVYVGVVGLISPSMGREVISMVGSLRRKIMRRRDRPATPPGSAAEDRLADPAAPPITPEGDQTT